LLIAQEGINQFAQKFACLFLETRKRTQKSQNSGKSVLSSILTKGSSCSSETKHNRRTATRPMLFVSKRRLQKQRPEPQKTVLGSSLGEDVVFRDNNDNFFYDIQQYISNDQTYGKLFGNKD
jgi:hypothetical protein